MAPVREGEGPVPGGYLDNADEIAAKRQAHPDDRPHEFESPGEPLTLPAGASSLLSDGRLQSRANGSVREALITSMQRTHGNRAVQRFLGRAHRAGEVGPGSKPPSPIQRRLMVTGDDPDIDRFKSIAEPGSGLLLAHDTGTGQMTPGGATFQQPRSPSFTSEMVRIMSDPVQDAEVHFGTHQARVAVGAFPSEHDLTAGREQRIDMDDIEALESGAPGEGLAALAHELEENYQAHGVTPVPGVDRFGPAHEQAKQTESDVAEDIVGPGRRVADRVADSGVPNIEFRAVNYQNYYVVFRMDSDPATKDVQVKDARRTGVQVISSHTIDHYLSGADWVPPPGEAVLAAVIADLRANSLATAIVEGFADAKGTPEGNMSASQRRADKIKKRLVGSGVVEERSVQAQGLGDTNFVAGNDTEAERAQNRRVEITVTAPDFNAAAFGLPGGGATGETTGEAVGGTAGNTIGGIGGAIGGIIGGTGGGTGFDPFQFVQAMRKP